MSYLPGPPWQQVMIPGRRERVFGVKVCGSLELHSVLKACLESLCWNWVLSLILDNTLLPVFVFVWDQFTDCACYSVEKARFQHGTKRRTKG